MPDCGKTGLFRIFEGILAAIAAPAAGAKTAAPEAKEPAPKAKMTGTGFSSVSIIVTGGSNNKYYSVGGLRCM
jgi:hypothetical protein